MPFSPYFYSKLGQTTQPLFLKAIDESLSYLDENLDGIYESSVKPEDGIHNPSTLTRITHFDS